MPYFDGGRIKNLDYVRRFNRGIYHDCYLSDSTSEVYFEKRIPVCREGIFSEIIKTERLFNTRREAHHLARFGLD